MGGAAKVRAAGGVLWRPTGGGIVVAVVHRPRYDDWSLPKGKLQDGEPPLAGAVREVAEETGCSAVAGRTLGTSHYSVLLDGRLVPKTVRWWAMRATGPTGHGPDPDEVDEVRWLAPDAAAALLTAGRDRAPLDALVATGTRTTTVLLVRHASAGDRRSWDGPDVERPLDERGRRQAAALAGLLPAYGPVRVLSAPAVRCVQTVTGLGLPVEVDPVVSDSAYHADPAAAVERLRALATGEGAVVVGSQGGAVPGLVRALTGADDEVPARKGSVWALTFAGGEVVDADHTAPLA